MKLGGREFDVIASGTIEYDVTLLNLLQSCGLSDVTMHAGETAEGLAFRVFRTLMSSGAVFEILGCVLIPAGTNPMDWDPALMRQTAGFVRKLALPEDKAAINSQITTLVASFFQRGVLSVRTFPNSSSLRNGADPGKHPVQILQESSTPSLESGD
jgi:hypothetical protein